MKTLMLFLCLSASLTGCLFEAEPKPQNEAGAVRGLRIFSSESSNGEMELALEMKIGTRLALKVCKVQKGGCTSISPSEIQWSSSNPAVISIDREGNLSALIEGESVLSAQYEKESGSLKAKVVGNRADSLTLEIRTDYKFGLEETKGEVSFEYEFFYPSMDIAYGVGASVETPAAEDDLFPVVDLNPGQTTKLAERIDLTNEAFSGMVPVTAELSRQENYVGSFAEQDWKCKLVAPFADIGCHFNGYNSSTKKFTAQIEIPKDQVNKNPVQVFASNPAEAQLQGLSNSIETGDVKYRIRTYGGLFFSGFPYGMAAISSNAEGTEFEGLVYSSYSPGQYISLSSQKGVYLTFTPVRPVPFQGGNCFNKITGTSAHPVAHVYCPFLGRITEILTVTESDGVRMMQMGDKMYFLTGKSLHSYDGETIKRLNGPKLWSKWSFFQGKIFLLADPYGSGAGVYSFDGQKFRRHYAPGAFNMFPMGNRLYLGGYAYWENGSIYRVHGINNPWDATATPPYGLHQGKLYSGDEASLKVYDGTKLETIANFSSVVRQVYSYGGKLYISAGGTFVYDGEKILRLSASEKIFFFVRDNRLFTSGQTLESICDTSAGCD